MHLAEKTVKNYVSLVLLKLRMSGDPRPLPVLPGSRSVTGVPVITRGEREGHRLHYAWSSRSRAQSTRTSKAIATVIATCSAISYGE